MTAFLKANKSYQLTHAIKKSADNFHIFFGEKEKRIIKRSDVLIRDAVRASSMMELPDMFHGDFSINHPLEYVKAVKAIVDKF